MESGLGLGFLSGLGLGNEVILGLLETVSTSILLTGRLVWD